MMTTTVSSSSPVSEPEPDDTESPGPNPTALLLHLSFNQDRTSFSAGTDSGFRVYSCDPFLLHSDPDSGPRGGVGLVQMHFRHSFAVVGGGPDPFCPVNVVKLWDDRASKCVAELQFRSEVKSVKFLRDRIVVVVKHKVFLYSIPDLKLSSVMTTIENPRGLCDVSYKSGQAVLACPGLHPGQVRVEHYGSQRTKFIMAHCSSLACLALTSDGRFLATASRKGTLVRVFNTLDCTLLQEVRRGTEKADIYSLAFSSTSQWLAVSSGKGTVHVFNLKVLSDSMENDRSPSTSGISISNPSGISSLYFIKAVLPNYFSSEWSVAQFRLQEGVKYVVTFGHQKNTVVIIGMDGSFYRCQFDPVNGGEMTQLEYHNFLKLE